MAHEQPWLVDEFLSPTAVLDTPTFSVLPTDLQFQGNQVLSTHILIRDPPSKWRLPAEAGQFREDSDLFLTCFPGKSNKIPTADLYINLVNQLPISCTESTKPVPSPSRRQKVKMAKKRRSLQSIFAPSFLNAPPSPTSTDSSSSYFVNPQTTRMRSFSSAARAPYDYPAIPLDLSQSVQSNTSPRASPPPDFLLDDDPFANLSAAPITSRPATIVDTIPLEPSPAKPRSPLTPTTPEAKQVPKSPPSTPMPVGVSRALSGRARPAYQKPAFAPRPSLPSLHTLASMNVVLTKRVRKGRVGAGLPFEPWDSIDNEASSGESSTTQSPSPPSAITLPVQSGNADFVADLDLNFLDLSDEDHDDTDTSHFADTSAYEGILDALDSSHLDLESITQSSGDLSPPPLSRTVSSEISSLTRSTSLTSNSSAGSFDAHPWANYSGANMSSTESDSDILSSPPDDFLTFPTSRYSDDALYDSFGYDNDAHEALFSDVNFLGESDLTYEPGTSAGTIRPSVEPKTANKPSLALDMQTTDDEPVDGGDWNGGRSGHSSVSAGIGLGQNSGSGRMNGNSNFGSNDRRGFGGRDDDGHDDKRRVNNSAFSTSSDSDTSDDTEDESADDYGKPATGLAPVASGSSSVSDDDVPLAQRIPTALRAQRTIRRQVREERDQRRKERALRAEQSSARVRQTTLRPGTSEPLSPQMMTSSQEAALHASRPVTRPRTRTLPASEMKPFAPEDLSRRLEAMGMPEVPVSRGSASISRKSKDGVERPSSAGRGLRDPGSTFHQFFSSSQNSPAEPARGLRPSRSFHKPEGWKAEEHRAPMPIDAAQLGRSTTRARPRDNSIGSHGVTPRSFPSSTSPDLVRSGEDGRKLTKANPDSKPAQTSIELERPPRPSLQRPPVPPLPPSEVMVNGPHANRGSVTQQRIFVGDMQRFNMIELGPSTSAGDVIDILEAQGTLKGWVGSGGWMVWEIAQDFGMERPIRSFELLVDVQASWNKDKMLNTFIVKLTPLAPLLSRSAIPSSSPTHSGYVEWEVKRGKWNKRWLQLREHGLWLSKRDNGRDETLICSLSNFDAYHITRLQKTPRPFAFAVKSTDNLSFFENTADYLHMFSCSEKEGKVWMENILLARSYVLQQERQVLFNPKAPNGNAAGAAGALSRSGTRKRPAQPLVAVSPPFTGAQVAYSGDVFEPGSLLHKA